MAPAVRMDVFEDCVVPHLKSGKVKRKAILGYDRSLLYLVSQSFESGEETPILGMEKYFGAMASQGLPGVHVWAAPSAQSKSTTHGGFDDASTMASVIALIKGQDI